MPFDLKDIEVASSLYNRSAYKIPEQKGETTKCIYVADKLKRDIHIYICLSEGRLIVVRKV